MSPPPLFALVLVGAWVLMIFAVTNATGHAQLRAEEQEWDIDSEPHARALPKSDE